MQVPIRQETTVQEFSQPDPGLWHTAILSISSMFRATWDVRIYICRIGSEQAYYDLVITSIDLKQSIMFLGLR